jgi:uncharacterized metal-binding protein
MENKIIVFPCSGIGKSLGTVTREAAYEVCLELRPGSTKIGALSLLVMGDADSRSEVSKSTSITIDGCKLACASKMVKECDGQILIEVSILDEIRKHRELKPEGIAELNEGGMILARAIAADIAEAVDRSSNKEVQNA